MPNLFAIKPDLPSLDTRTRWVCPFSKIDVPKIPVDNLQWRVKLMELCEKDAEFRQDIYTACSQSLLFFVNAFAFTLRVFEPGAGGANKQAPHQHLPFVTWEVQDEHLLEIEKAINEGRELLTDKSRDMGATWNHIAVYTHRLLFRNDESHLMISRKEAAVDLLDGQAKNYPFGTLADPGTLFGKIDYLLSRLPEWMLPRLTRKSMHIVNQDSRSRIDGESSNASAGSSDRRKSIFLDEMAKMAEGEAIKRSTRDVTACRLVCSTPNGAGTAFSKWRMSGQIPVFSLMWWRHPAKGRDAYVEQDKMGRWRILSPWYNNELAARSPKEVAIEIDADHVGSGDTFFEAVVLEQHKRMHARPPRRQASISFKKKFSDDDIIRFLRMRRCEEVTVAPKGPWNIWCELVAGRPDQSKTYLFGIDLGKGQGASNSVISVVCQETREKVAEFADANTPPYEMARIACAAGLWFGGRSRMPLVAWENNGDPGFDFGKQFVHVYKYPSIFFHRQSGTLKRRTGKRYGWRSTQESKAEVLGGLRRAYAHGLFFNRSVPAVAEAGTYISYENGGVGPAELVVESDSARKAHGDRVIADALCVMLMSETGILKGPGHTTPDRTFAKRFEAFKRRKEERKKGRPETHFNFAVPA